MLRKSGKCFESCAGFLQLLNDSGMNLAMSHALVPFHSTKQSTLLSQKPQNVFSSCPNSPRMTVTGRKSETFCVEKGVQMSMRRGKESIARSVVQRLSFYD